MKILFGIQGTGHGHISRAREILPELQKYADVDVLLSGYSSHMNLTFNSVSWKRGISLLYDQKDRVSVTKTLSNLNINSFLTDIMDLPIKNYDLIISDFEPITSWSARKSDIPVIGLSHQASFLSMLTPRPSDYSFFAEKVLQCYAPCSKSFGFHFLRYDEFIYPPVIRSEIRNLKPRQNGHITVYLPAYNDNFLIDIFQKIPSKEWEIFSIHTTEAFRNRNCLVKPVQNDSFLQSLEACDGVVTGGGFETCAETLYLHKKLIVVPITNQYEQRCNAAALAQLGIPVLPRLNQASLTVLRDWLHQIPVAQLPEYCDVSKLISHILQSSGSLQIQAA